MRTLKQLVENRDRVWVYLDNEQLGNDFLRQAAAEGFLSGKGLPLSSISWSHVMTLNHDLTVTYPPMFIWVWSFRGDIEGTPLRIDYEKYRAGEKDYLCRRSHISQAGDPADPAQSGSGCGNLRFL